MLLILSLGLLPLGLIALFASVQSAQQNRQDRNDEIQARVDVSAQQLTEAIQRSTLTIRAADAAVAATESQSPVCERTLARLTGSGMLSGAYALHDAAGQPRCATPGFAPLQIMTRGTPNSTQASIMGGNDALRFTLFGPAGYVEAIGEFSRDAVAQITRLNNPEGDYRLELVQGSTTMMLHENASGNALMRQIARTSPVIGTKLQVRLTASVVPITAVDLLIVLLPIMMWVAAAIIGWMIVDRLLLKPLVRMQRVVSAYRPGDAGLDLPTLATPAREIGALGKAFDQVTRTVARHEADLEAAVERQTRLVREVHHRVKNNLQVVASLLNLHSRGSRNEEVAAAYASIQRRVDALAVVHRNHYAELEENRGVALKPLISELAANLRATAPRNATGMSISLNIEPYYSNQDVAVSVAFLITEIVEFAMFCGASGVRISLMSELGGSAQLMIESDALQEGTECDPDTVERFERIVTGLARQLRSTLARDHQIGTYTVTIAVVDRADR
jgi:two-component sensor histidine kinase